MMVSDEDFDRITREALRLSTELMTAQTLQDGEARRLSMQNIADFLSRSPEETEARFTAYIQANAHLSAFLVDFAAKASKWPVEQMVQYVAQHISTRTDDDETKTERDR